MIISLKEIQVISLKWKEIYLKVQLIFVLSVDSSSSTSSASRIQLWMVGPKDSWTDDPTRVHISVLVHFRMSLQNDQFIIFFVCHYYYCCFCYGETLTRPLTESRHRRHFLCLLTVIKNVPLFFFCILCSCCIIPNINAGYYCC